MNPPEKSPMICLAFEFTSDGERRYTGEIVMLGSRVVGVQAQLHRILH